MSAAAAFLLRKPAARAPSASGRCRRAATSCPQHFRYQPAAAKNAALLNVLKEELFALESEKISGTITPEEYAQVKAALETVLKRALKKSS